MIPVRRQVRHLPDDPPADRLQRLRDALDAWMSDPSHPETATLGAPGGLEGTIVLDDLLGRLRRDDTRLAATATSHLGLPRSTTYGQLARLLWWARKDPNGPRCRSYRAALYLVGELDDDVRDDVLGPSITGRARRQGRATTRRS